MSLLQAVPVFDAQLAESVARDRYGIRSRASLLPSERDQNFLLTSELGQEFVLKIANGLEQSSLLESQNEAMGHLAKRLSYCPQVVPTTSREQMFEVDAPSGGSHFVRLLTCLPGVPLGTVKEQSPALLCDFGKKLGRLDRELATFDHPAAHRDFHWDLANGSRIVESHGGLIASPKMREVAFRGAEYFQANLGPHIQDLRRSVIHGDANDYNVLAGFDETGAQRVTGLIDFGDMVHSYTIGDLAVAIAYAVLGKADPIGTALWLVTGYAEEYPLTGVEIEALFELVRMRLCMSLCLAAYQLKQRPQNEYLSISQQAITDTLPALVEIDSREVARAFRDVCHY
jgi:Ser/Thr protein kinase RdoA (MazF antagonist)